MPGRTDLDYTFEDGIYLGPHGTTRVKLGNDGSGGFVLSGHTLPTAYTQTYATASRTHSNPTAASLTDNSGGTGGDTLAAVTALDALTDSTTGTADDTVDDVSTAVTGVDGTGSNAASKADVDTRLTAINNNFKELVDQVITSKTNTDNIQDALASLADQINALVVDVANVKQVLNAVIDDGQSYGLLE